MFIFSILAVEPGAYLVEVLRYITDTLQENGAGALAMALVKKAAIRKNFRFRDFNRSFCRRSSTIRFIPAKFGCTFNRR
ncbi:MAG UNVERIFIED_CONTAM: hypothetical protein LVR29_04930 [Microcystis novacekii LVE1205-3]|jgi:hypothetical protein